MSKMTGVGPFTVQVQNASGTWTQLDGTIDDSFVLFDDGVLCVRRKGITTTGLIRYYSPSTWFLFSRSVPQGVEPATWEVEQAQLGLPP